jgi:hypothetical protein
MDLYLFYNRKGVPLSFFIIAVVGIFHSFLVQLIWYFLDIVISRH